ncbi:ATPase domain-containing protein [Pseudomonas auratipiscis]|uniref:non-specific serine/threonine protein kinase n=1 Tax=Pseudomonas auratipiscis TaxID=3115853 RepID=A0AB35WXE0_9PSED|nr:MULTISPECIES: ATPase domain-containing protein [unclassified Pseudomonas]MEE1869132.1 ATPase domain-containing protein [Pseudomonas sp. 120P]MEE1959886.1 ATPase domain-containing protein [Pseudomonas sp. 119P]
MVEQLKRLASGIDGLDALLKGGLIVGASYIIQGAPGSGKTILANQLAFNHVGQGGRVLVATLLSESHERLFQYLSTLSFFDPSLVGKQIQFVSAFDTLERDGLDQVVKLLRGEISRHQATLLVVDGLLTARSRAESSLDTKKFIAGLQGHAAFAGCSVVFLTSSRLDDGSPEHTMVDGVIELGETLFSSRSVRRIQVRKTRGSGALSGLHECEITADGLQVYPRLESLYSYPSSMGSEELTRVGSGIKVLDELLGGGLPGSSITLVMGPSGIGKTSLGLSFLAAATTEEPGLHFGFYETPARLRLKASALGHNFAAMEQEGALHIAWQPTTEGILDDVGARLLRLVREKKIRRVLIDSLGAFTRLATTPERLNEFFRALAGELRALDVSVVATWEMRDIFGSEINAPAPDLSSIVDNLMLMRFVEFDSQLKRLLSILKVRDSGYDPALLELTFSNHGIDLKKTFTQAMAVLSGTPVLAAGK